MPRIRGSGWPACRSRTTPGGPATWPSSTRRTAGPGSWCGGSPTPRISGGSTLPNQETQALVVPAGVVGVRGDRQECAEAAAFLVELMDLVHALGGVADEPQVFH